MSTIKCVKDASGNEIPNIIKRRETGRRWIIKDLIYYDKNKQNEYEK